MSRKIYNRLSLMAVSCLDESTLMPVARCLLQSVNFALEKALRRHAAMRTGTAQELWRDLNSPGPGAAELITPDPAEPRPPDTPKASEQPSAPAPPEGDRK